MPSPVVTVAELADLGEVRLVDARSRQAWAQGHLAGAVSADLEVELSRTGDPAVGGRHPLPPLEAWCRQLGDWGIGPGTTVVAYDDAGGGNAAARLWWMLRAVGHESVAVLDGGLAAAVAGGLETTAESSEVVAVGPYPADEKAWSEATVDADRVEELRGDAEACVIDVRAVSRYRGESDPFDPNPGHIPGAVNKPYAENLDAAGRWRSAADLRAAYEALLDGRSPESTVVYCGSGVTACHTLLALERAGLPGASLYVGSWSEWGRSDRPKATVVES
ncbi:MAG: sulfurtransferase [Thermoanaerobaculia bacterium]|nr:sulfurtransferase [Thermoanaerobaculia bacterium]